jgi:hypothetical protein
VQAYLPPFGAELLARGAGTPMVPNEKKQESAAPNGSCLSRAKKHVEMSAGSCTMCVQL